MDSEFTLISHQPPSLLPADFFYFYFLNPHVLTQVCDQMLWKSRARSSQVKSTRGRVGLKEGVCRVVTADSTEQTLKASSFPNDVKKQRR